MIHEGYGMSETTGPHCLMVGDVPKLGCVGQAIAGVETKLINADIDGKIISDKIIEKYAPNVVEGVQKLSNWAKNL